MLLLLLLVSSPVLAGDLVLLLVHELLRLAQPDIFVLDLFVCLFSMLHLAQCVPIA